MDGREPVVLCNCFRNLYVVHCGWFYCINQEWYIPCSAGTICTKGPDDDDHPHDSLYSVHIDDLGIQAAAHIYMFGAGAEWDPRGWPYREEISSSKSLFHAYRGVILWRMTRSRHLPIITAISSKAMPQTARCMPSPIIAACQLGNRDD